MKHISGKWHHCGDNNYDEINATLGLLCLARRTKCQNINMGELCANDATTPECLSAIINKRRF